MDTDCFGSAVPMSLPGVVRQGPASVPRGVEIVSPPPTPSLVIASPPAPILAIVSQVCAEGCESLSHNLMQVLEIVSPDQPSELLSDDVEIVSSLPSSSVIVSPSTPMQAIVSQACAEGCESLSHNLMQALEIVSPGRPSELFSDGVTLSIGVQPCTLRTLHTGAPPGLHLGSICAPSAPHAPPVRPSALPRA